MYRTPLTADWAVLTEWQADIVNLIADKHEYELWVDNVRFGDLPTYDSYVLEKVSTTNFHMSIDCCSCLSESYLILRRTGEEQGLAIHTYKQVEQRMGW